MDKSRMKHISVRMANKSIRVEACWAKEGILCQACRTLVIGMKDDCTEWLSEYERLEKEGQSE